MLFRLATCSVADLATTHTRVQCVSVSLAPCAAILAFMHSSSDLTDASMARQWRR